MNKLALPILAGATVLMVGCGSPQKITVQPNPYVPGAAVATGQNIAIFVDDKTSQPVLDTPDDKVRLVPKNDARSVISQTLTNAFKARGFNADEGTTTGTPVKVSLLRFYTDIEEKPGNDRIHAGITLNVAINDTTKTFSRDATQDEPGHISEDDASEVMNDLVNTLLTDVTNDPKLLQAALQQTPTAGNF
ncbi:MAG: hypothetical protein HYV16_06685 [Gammaproteobacteria bacterium]|nr:hypothetical protein [Gammaproteobacteria bacterium]